MIGKQISHYHILEKLGEGGMGVVYKAEDTKLKRNVAIKFLPRHISENSEEKKRFEIEAQAAAALNHPNITTIYAIEEDNDDMFIVMEYIKGQELKDLIANSLLSPLTTGGPEGEQLPVDKVINYAIQIAEGLRAAHEKGIIHRDIKSSNIMITNEDKVKIMDFGLAKVKGETQLTKVGSTVGTAAYMSPEQARGIEVDQRTDIWSFGVVIYEALTGHLPFSNDYDAALMYSILNEQPDLIDKYRSDISKELKNIVNGCLEKDPQKRFQSFGEIINRFNLFQEASKGSKENLNSFKRQLRKPKVFIPAIIIITLVVIIALIPYYQLLKRNQAEQKIPVIKNFVKEGKYFEAFQLAKEEEKYLKNDSTFNSLIPDYSDFLTVISKPAGAKVYIKRYTPNKKENTMSKEYAGLTPIHNLQVIRGGYLVYFEKDGFAPVERVFSSAYGPEEVKNAYGLKETKRLTNITIVVNLLDKNKAIKNMVFVPGGKYHLVGWDAPTSKDVQLSDYYIDKYEVSNRDFKSFITAGGYTKKQYWKYPFIKDGKDISWEEAMSQFVDRTGLPGPRSWTNQDYPADKDKYPVTEISWYEAAAYAEFVDKKLPTIFQWEKAARNGEYEIYDLVMPWGLKSPNENVLHRANFESNGTLPVDSFEFGISPFGCFNIAGNVKEWCLNETKNGNVATGGSWQDPIYTFAYFGAFPSFYSSDAIGFRCVRIVGKDTGEDSQIKIDVKKDIPVYRPVERKTYMTFLSQYRYDKKPLNPEIVETTETPDWTKEKIKFSGLDNDTILAYLYLPKRAAQPYQCLEWIPHSGIINGNERVDDAAEIEFSAQIKSGRALLAIVPLGAIGRPHKPGFEWPDIETVKYREQTINYVNEFRIGIDYLETRKDIDLKKLAFVGTSWGSTNVGIILASIEKRYHSVIFIAGGIHRYAAKMLPEVNPVNFAPYIKPPKLLLNGRYDEAFPPETEAMPFYKLLSPPKQLSLTESGHVPTLEKRIIIINKWLDKTLGPVSFKQ
jgi:serine/threonine protein kinase/formylglycine-generating enzyme required for sulfatase activity